MWRTINMLVESEEGTILYDDALFNIFCTDSSLARRGAVRRSHGRHAFLGLARRIGSLTSPCLCTRLCALVDSVCQRATTLP
jgi:hypothetical protein